MLALLRSDGFPPLHYESYWLLAQILGPGRLTPFWMRFLPALAGTLMVPAMYFLARQFTSRPRATFVAAFTAVSAYLIATSAFAKMYAALWLFTTLSVACLFWWLRTRRRVAWLLWVASTTAACGFHAAGFALVPLSVLFAATSGALGVHRAHRARVIAALAAGVLVIAAGPLAYYTLFNHWTSGVRARGWVASGLLWADELNYGAAAPELIRSTASAYLCGWEWPGRRDLNIINQHAPSAAALGPSRPQLESLGTLLHIPPGVLATLPAAVAGLFVLALVGCLPWRRESVAGRGRGGGPHGGWWRRRRRR